MLPEPRPIRCPQAARLLFLKINRSLAPRRARPLVGFPLHWDGMCSPLGASKASCSPTCVLLDLSPLLLCLCSPHVLLGLGAPPPCPRPLPDHPFSYTSPAYLPRQVRYVSARCTHDPPVQGSLPRPRPCPLPQRPLFPLEVLITPCNSYGFLVSCLSAPLACKLPEVRGCIWLAQLPVLSA